MKWEGSSLQIHPKRTLNFPNARITRTHNDTSASHYSIVFRPLKISEDPLKTRSQGSTRPFWVLFLFRGLAGIGHIYYIDEPVYIHFLPLTVTVKENEAVFPAWSTAVYVTTVSPMRKSTPDLWLVVTVYRPELSLTSGAVHDTLVWSVPISTIADWSSAVVMKTGGSVSVTNQLLRSMMKLKMKITEYLQDPPDCSHIMSIMLDYYQTDTNVCISASHT